MAKTTERIHIKWSAVTLDKEDYKFFREAVQHVASSLDLPQAMLSVYEFLKQYFPLVALSFHKFEKQFDAMHLLIFGYRRKVSVLE